MDEEEAPTETQSGTETNMDEAPIGTQINMEVESEIDTCSEKSLEMLVEEQSRGVSFLNNDEDKYSDSQSESSGEPPESLSETTDNKTDIDESSAILDVKGSRDLHPKIVQSYRAEPKSEAELSAKSNHSGLDSPVMITYIGYDGRERTMVSLVTQTDWDWVDEALIKQENEKEESESESVEQPISTKRLSKTDLILPPITAKSVSGRDLMSRGKTNGTLTSLDTTSLKSPFSMPPNDEFGIPLLDMTSSDDDSCSDDDVPKTTSEEPPLLPSIGPPQILQYIRESEHEELSDFDIADFALDENGRPIGIFCGKCEFCEQEIKPFPTIEQQQEQPPEELYCCDQYREFVQFATSTAFELEEEMQKTKKLIDIKPHGHFGSKKARKAAKERAVQRMRERELEKRKLEASGMNSYFAGASPSGEFGSATEMAGGRAGAGRNQVFKGSGPAPLSYKDMGDNSYDNTDETDQSDINSNDQSNSGFNKVNQSNSNVNRINQSTPSFGVRGPISSIRTHHSRATPMSSIVNMKTKIGPGFHGNYSHSNTATDTVDGKESSKKAPQVYIGAQMARQMKTINYQLSSQKCLEEGWTKRPPTPEEDDGDMIDVFIPEPLDFTLANSAKIQERKLIQKNYENGKKFLMIFPDGTGSVFYPSGYLAVSICKMDAGQFIYVVHDNSSDGRIMGVFEPNGHGCCYHNNGNVRLYFDQLDGIELDKYGAKKKKWSWKDQETHVHAPPFQPICIGLNRSIGLRVMTQEHITVTFMTKNRSCRFNVGARLKLMKPENIKPKEISDNMIFMEEKAVQIESILHKVSNLLRFPHSPKIDKILPPLRITHRMQKVELLRSRQKAKRQTFFPSRSTLNPTSTSASNASLPAVIVN